MFQGIKRHQLKERARKSNFNNNFCYFDQICIRNNKAKYKLKDESSGKSRKEGRKEGRRTKVF